MPEDESTDASNGQAESADFAEPAPPEFESDADMEAHVDRLVSEYSIPEDYDKVTNSGIFRRETMRLMDGAITVSQWGDALAEALNEAFDVPLLDEESEQKMFDGAVDVIGGALRGFLRADVTDMEALSKDSEFRFQTIMLMEGEVTVPEWTDTLAKILNEKVDIPWVPEVAEGMIFRKGIEIIGNVLHGYFRGGSGRVNVVESVTESFEWQRA